MTILEQPIDPDQIQLVPNTITTICLYMTIAIIMAFIGFICVTTVSNKSKKGEISDKSYILGTFLSVFIMVSGMIGIYPINTYAYKVPGLDHFSEPQGDPYSLSFSDKPLFADTYRNEINDAVTDKLGDYDMPECAIDKGENYKSLLCPDGRHTEKLAATQDGKTYTLTPHLDYDKNTSIATLDVDIEEGYHE